MPLIQVKVVEGSFTQRQKQQVIEKLTDTMLSVEGRTLRPITWVLIEEVKTSEWAIGKKEIPTYDIQVKIAEGVFSQGQKQQVIQGLTDVMSFIEGKSKRPTNWVKVDEVKDGDFGIGGKVMTRADLLALAAESFERF